MILFFKNKKKLFTHLSPGPVCFVWQVDSVHHKDLRSPLVNDTEERSSSGLQCQMLLGRKDPLGPNVFKNITFVDKGISNRSNSNENLFY